MEKQSLTQQTAQRLYGRIVTEGGLAPGDKLPNELDLSRELGVSRTTLREAVRMLVAQGVLEVRRGKGTFVSARVEDIDDFGFAGLRRVKGQLRDLFELRSIFEPQAAMLACRRATVEERADILARGKEVEDCIRSGADRTRADAAFHAAIVRATHNEFMVRLLPLIQRAVATAVETGEKAERLAADTLRDHALLLEFFARGDAEGARHAMAIHMRHAVDEMGLGDEETP
ncbi:FadR/GntR family transcriptional regulator [uncultured Pseudoflavonifractor sp.]|uniref:FadR/GntR family transcriptional regulator n=1 Tax=uncultured Pseudoflavonifractor sp. TaxID=1221379 RepID=UPI0025F5EFEC|nr:FadR/GntR family transcriptional regulator [uncultured Pseudoflavonifractor sp.]